MNDELKAENRQIETEESELTDEQPQGAETAAPYAGLIDGMVDHLDAYFAEHLENMLSETDRLLFDGARHAGSIAQQNSMFEFMNHLRVQKNDIERKFYDELNLYLRPVAESPRLPRSKQNRQSDELMLVDNDEMDELVTMTSITSKANTDFQEEISHLIARLQQVALENSSVFHPEALRPVHICNAFRDAVSDSGFSNENKMILYRQFDQDVIRNIRTLYDDLNEMLIAADVLPKIELGGGINLGGPAGGYDDYAEDEEDDEDIELPLAQPPVPPGGYAGPRIGPGRAGSFRVSAQARAAQSPQPTGEVLQGSFAGMPLSQIRQSIQDFVGGTPSDADSVSPAGGGGYYTRQDVVSALSDLQMHAQIADTKLEFNAAAIKKAVLSTIGDREGGVVSKRVNQISEKTIDFIKLIFDAIIDDKSITDTIKTLLLSLQIPVIKAAMLDAEFFVDDKHPARQLLDKIAEAGVGVSDHKDPVYVDIEAVVRKLLVEYQEDVAAFADALDALIAITEEIYARAREKEEESQRQVRHAHARNVVLQEIRKITLGKELPRGIRTLVLKVWPSLMFNHYLKQGKANDEWVEMLMILAKIIDSVQPVTSKAELDELGLSYEDIVRATENKLRQRGKATATVDDVIADLRSTYEALIQTRNLPEDEEAVLETATETESGVEQFPVIEAVGDEQPEQQVQDERNQQAAEAVSEPVSSEADGELTARNKIAALPDEVQPGAWFIVYHGDDKPVRRLKLAVILMQDATLVFVDHLGNVVIEKDAEVFAGELVGGLSSVIMQHSVFDHALKSALSNITH